MYAKINFFNISTFHRSEVVMSLKKHGAVTTAAAAGWAFVAESKIAGT